MRKNVRRSKVPKAQKKQKFPQQLKTASTLSGPRIMPDELDTRLLYRNLFLLNNVGGGFAAKEFKSNDAYDVDPALGSTETLGFDEYAALYSYYRVIGISWKLVVSNADVTPSNVYVLNSNLSPSTAGTNYLLYSSNPYCYSHLLGPSTGDSNHTFKGSLSFSRLLGSNNVETADSFRAVTTGNPVDLLYFSIGVDTTAAGGTLPNGVVCDLSLTLHVRFYGREIDLALAAVMARMERLRTQREKAEIQKKLCPSSGITGTCTRLKRDKTA